MTEDRRKYKYFGSGEIETERVRFHKFGQEIALTDAEALDCVEVGGLLLSEDFDAIGWTPMEKSNKHARSGEAFMARHKQAMAKRAELLKQLHEAKEPNLDVD